MASPHEVLGLSGEALKHTLSPVSHDRAQDALVGVEASVYESWAQRSTVGPYSQDRLFSQEVGDALKNPSLTQAFILGRNEHARGNLLPTLSDAMQRTGGRVIYVDANSSDDSAGVAEAQGVRVIRQSEALERIDKPALAKVLNVSPATLEGHTVPGDPPLRKGATALAARIEMMDLMDEITAKTSTNGHGKFKPYMLLMDCDLKSIQGGTLAPALSEHQIYYPLELLTAGLFELHGMRDDTQQQLAVFTASGGRNNEAIKALFNTIIVDSENPMLSKEQQEVAHALGYAPGILTHPLTGELAVSLPAELLSMGATGQLLETVRILSLSAMQHETFITNPDADTTVPLLGNVRRGTQERMDEPQPDKKEWWMITGLIPQFTRAVVSYMIHVAKLPHRLTMEDYERINHWLSRIKDSARIDKDTQTSAFDRSPMERLIPPVALLREEGLLS